MTKRLSCGWVCGSNYPFLTRKERDIETGLDYFLARYYSSGQGRFTSPDEFKGGPDALYDFADTASSNPTFYADLNNPQSLNKYQYTYNNPLAYVDPDGHCPECKKAADAILDVKIGVDKAGINILIRTANLVSGSEIPELQPTSKWQELGMTEGDRAGLILSFAGGRGPANVMMAESKTAVTTTEAAISTANQAQLLPKAIRPAAAGAGTAVTGEQFTATSGSAKLHATVQKRLDNIPKSARTTRPPGACCEPKIISQMLDAGVNPKGAAISVVRVRAQGNPNHATPMEPCRTCRLLLDAINK